MSRGGPAVATGPVTTITRHVAARPERVFAELSDGWGYSAWVVGAAHIRAVDPGWPAAGSRIHHAVGPWPVVIQDTTTVQEVSPGARLALRARIWPAGEAVVEFVLTAAGEGTELTMTETVVAGPLRLLGPLAAAGSKVRNGETLDRLTARVVRPAHPAAQ